MKEKLSNQISAFEAKTHFSNLIKRVKDGEKFTILKHNAPIAILMPIPSQQRFNIEEAIKNLGEFRQGKKLAGLSLKELITAGRK
ncbi:type II toxin-antitoxin system Phd/YefM family antitoxin [Candidatus Tisiphia endosymbiont of Xenochironomus xenolabis]|uniref:type II toxin-antitoxin system Phd/YefM family antitoxin n=1 Tax=unclassified Candidatus Tisiphia TaxID=2996318 RepID=UPI0035C8C8AF